MCGIITHLSLNVNSRITPQVCQDLNDLLTHRGPDDAGVFLSDDVALAMRRLSIVDLCGGHQPLSSADGRYTIVFNGEIYNHHALRGDLEAKKFVFRTKSDTEAILNAYIAWGKDCLKYLNGMFAFSIWDAKAKTLFVARDRLGMKPLYYAQDPNRIFFASELTPIVKSKFFDLRLNLKAISDYLSYWYICEPDTIFENVHQLPPGHFAFIENGTMRIERFWSIPSGKEEVMSFEQARDSVHALLKDAVGSHLGADVPLGTFLSGGIDSGLVTAIASQQAKGRIQSFGIGFKDKSYDETVLAQMTADRHGIDLNVHIMEDISPALIEEIIGAFDEPLGNASYVPAYLLARAARSKLKVVLTGDGGDELFGGYPTYQAPYYQAMWHKTPHFLQNIIRRRVAAMPVSHQRISLDFRLKQLMQGIDADYKRAHCTWRQVASLSAQERLWYGDIYQKLGGYDPFTVAARYFEEAKNLSTINQLMYVDLNTYLLNDHLRKVDRMTMAHGLEARLPFMDYRMVELAMRMPAQHKVDLFKTKKVLKAVAKDYLSDQVINGKKKGLTSPIAGWIDGPLKEYFSDVLKGGIAAQLFEPNEINRLLSEHAAKQKDHSRILWALLTLQVWHRKHIG